MDFAYALEALDRLGDLLSARAAGGWMANLWCDEGLRVEVRGAKPSEIERWQNASLSLQMADQKGRVGFAQAPLGRAGFDAEALVARALASARALPADPLKELPRYLDALPEADLQTDDPAYAAVTEANALELAAILEESSLAPKAGVTLGARKPAFEAARELRVIHLKGGREARWTATDFALQTEVAATGADSAESAWASREARFLSDLDPRLVGAEARVRAVDLLGARKAPTGRFPVLIDHRVAAEMLELMAPSLLGESHQKKTSMFQGKLGQKVLSPLLTLVDDGLMPRGADTQPLDDEGSARRRTVCVKKGVLDNLLYDRATAKKAKTLTTGNGGGGPGSPVEPDATNLFIMAGTQSVDALINSMGRGLWVWEVMGLHTADDITGDFSVGCSGLWIEGGQRAYPVAGATLSGNLLDLLGSVAALGGDLTFQGSLGAPSLLCERADVAGG